MKCNGDIAHVATREEHETREKFTHTACTIMIGDRYFREFNAKGRVITAWCLAGARLFQLVGPELAGALAELRGKKRLKPRIVAVGPLS